MDDPRDKISYEVKDFVFNAVLAWLYEMCKSLVLKI